MKTLLLDLETAPAKVYTWGLYKQNIGLNQVIDPGHMLCWAAKWLGEKRVMSDMLPNHKLYKKDPSNDKEITKSVAALMDEADVVVGHNGDAFDIRWVQSRLAKHGLRPISPFKTVDTYKVTKRNMYLLSHKLEFLGTDFGLGQKIKHEGFGLWRKCLAGDKSAWKRMLKYNKQDVKLLERVYLQLRPFVPNHPSHSAYGGGCVCPNCGSHNRESRGYSYTTTAKYKRFVCKDCGKWYRDRNNLLTREEKRARAITL